MLNKEVLIATLNSNNCSITKTAKDIGYSRNHTYELIEKWGIKITKKAIDKCN